MAFSPKRPEEILKSMVFALLYFGDIRNDCIKHQLICSYIFVFLVGFDVPTTDLVRFGGCLKLIFIKGCFLNLRLNHLVQTLDCFSVGGLMTVFVVLRLLLIMVMMPLELLKVTNVLERQLTRASS
jgi:hypothetical protein